MRGLVEEELARLAQRREVLEKRILQSLLPPDKNDGRPVIVEIRAGTGGEEAALFAGDLFRMYQRFAESQDISLEMLSFSTTSGKGGVKEAIFALKGENAWKTFKYEAGTHRVQRVPETESSGRIHTSAVTVAILPEPEAVEIDLDPRDLRIDTFRSSGPGGQSVNTMDSAVRVTHLPTQLVVSCQDEKSQHKNKQKAFRILRARLLARKEREENRKRSSDRRQQIGSGDRSEKIRTYNFPQNRVTDHRINLSLYSLPEILEGKLEDLSLALAEREYRDASRNFRGAS
jgi:peptide chain release factor 1